MLSEQRIHWNFELIFHAPRALLEFCIFLHVTKSCRFYFIMFCCTGVILCFRVHSDYAQFNRPPSPVPCCSAFPFHRLCLTMLTSHTYVILVTEQRESETLLDLWHVWSLFIQIWPSHVCGFNKYAKQRFHVACKTFGEAARVRGRSIICRVHTAYL